MFNSNADVYTRDNPRRSGHTRPTAESVNKKLKAGQVVIIRKSWLPIYMSECNLLQEKVGCTFEYQGDVVQLIPVK